jgi:hypothetical protein
MSKQRRRFIPNFDSLETRVVPAGNVTASFRSNLLSITGDNEANGVSITNNGDGSVTVASLDDTTINNDVEFTFTTTRSFKVKVDMRGGDDIVDVIGGDAFVRAGSSIKMGAGFDTLTIDGLRGGDDSVIDGGADDDIISLTNGGFDEDFRLTGGAGLDTITVDNVFFAEDARIDAGSGDDVVTINNGRFYDEDHRILGGNGVDAITITASRFSEESTVDTGSGDDTLAIDDTVFHEDARINAGSGVDVVTLTFARFDKDSRFNLGSGDDEIQIGLASFFNKEASFDGGSGFDTFTHDGSNTWAKKHKVKNFELFQQGEVFPPVGDELIANPDVADVPVGGSVTFDVVGNDVAPDGASLDLTTLTISSPPTLGTAVANADGTITYTNTSGIEGQVDVFTYTISDDLGNTATGEVSVTLVAATGGTVTANPDAATVTAGVGSVINVAANDTTTAGTIDLATVVVTSLPANGTATANLDGTVTYTANAGTLATSDSFQYVISNSFGVTSSPATVSVTIDQPLAANLDTGTSIEGGSTTITVLANDTTPAGTTINPSSVVIVTPPTNGTALVNVDGSVSYTHNGTETTSDSFQYTFMNSAGNTSAAGTVNITVTPVNDAPVAVNDTVSLVGGVTSVINLIANDTDAEAQINPASIVIVSNPTQATVTVNADGTVTYFSNAGATGSDSFTYTVADQQGLVSNVATVSITLI